MFGETARRLAALGCPFWCLAVTPALADDSAATLAAGGLVLQKTDKIALVSEDLYLSATTVRISYRFRNLTTTDYSTTIAFPMPDFTGGGVNFETAVPDPASDNFMKFSTVVDGQPVSSQLEQRAFLTSDGKPDVEITSKLRALRIPLVPTVDATEAAVGQLPDNERKSLVDANILDVGESSNYKGEQTTLYPLWTLRSKYWRTQVFPKEQDIVVQQTYVPIAGNLVGVPSGFPDLDPKTRDAYRTKYCTDESFLKSARALYQRAGSEYAKTYSAFEQYVSYIITSGGNWAGPIGDFKLIVDKGDPSAFVSFCGSDIKKINPTQFEVEIKNFTPKHDIDILFLKADPAQ
ncbi:uncharacterized protein DUF4424 [Rhizobium sp. WW_1]|nr:uncharacterized protein DUF4424 [Rhizobium sp. WW_1]